MSSRRREFFLFKVSLFFLLYNKLLFLVPHDDGQPAHILTSQLVTSLPILCAPRNDGRQRSCCGIEKVPPPSAISNLEGTKEFPSEQAFLLDIVLIHDCPSPPGTCSSDAQAKMPSKTDGYQRTVQCLQIMMMHRATTSKSAFVYRPSSQIIEVYRYPRRRKICISARSTSRIQYRAGTLLRG